jgi:hypothetical protein
VAPPHAPGGQHAGRGVVDLCDRTHAATPVVARDVDDDVDGGRDLMPDRDGRHRLERQQREGLETRSGLGNTVGVHGRERPVVARVEGLQHVERLGPAHLADDDAIGSHAERGAHQVAHAHRADPLGVRGPRLEAHDVLLLEPQLGRLLDGHDALVGPDRAGQRVEQARLAGARATGDDDVGAAGDEAAAQVGRCAVEPEVVEVERAGREPADRDARPIGCQRRQDGVEPRSVGEAGVDHRRRAVETQAERSDNALGDATHGIVVEREGDPLEAAVTLHVAAAAAVQHDLADRAVGEQRLDRSEAAHVVHELVEHDVGLGRAEQRCAIVQQRGEAGSQRRRVEAEVLPRVDEQTAMHLRLDA